MDNPARDPERFWQKLIEHFFTDEHGELGYSDFLEMGEECGLLTIEEFGSGRFAIYVPVPKPD